MLCLCVRRFKNAQESTTEKEQNVHLVKSDLKGGMVKKKKTVNIYVFPNCVFSCLSGVGVKDCTSVEVKNPLLPVLCHSKILTLYVSPSYVVLAKKHFFLNPVLSSADPGKPAMPRQFEEVSKKESDDSRFNYYSHSAMGINYNIGCVCGWGCEGPEVCQ